MPEVMGAESGVRGHRLACPRAKKAIRGRGALWTAPDACDFSRVAANHWIMAATNPLDPAKDRSSMTEEGRDETDFLARIGRHAGIVRKVALSYGRSAADRHDLEQEIVAQLWKSYRTFDGKRPFSTWMYRIALNVAISIARGRRWSEHEPLASAESIADDDGALEREQGVRELRAFIASLDELNRALIVLYLDEHSYREIADILGISETNVATKINRVKQQLRQRMNPQGESAWNSMR
jgi:RNA polymerase sigma-70 factor (ECF subfamily)